jgi:hypothetical protein
MDHHAAGEDLSGARGLFLLLVLPVNAFGGTVVHGLLYLIRIGAALVDDDGIALFFIQFKYFRADFFAGTAGDTLGVDNIGNSHFAHGFLLGMASLEKRENCTLDCFSKIAS